MNELAKRAELGGDAEARTVTLMQDDGTEATRHVDDIYVIEEVE